MSDTFLRHVFLDLRPAGEPALRTEERSERRCNVVLVEIEEGIALRVSHT